MQQGAHHLDDEQGYVTGITLAHFVHGAERRGLDTRSLLSRHGIDPQQDFDPARRFSGRHYETLIAELVLASGDPLFGFHIGQQLIPGAYGVLGHLLLGSQSIDDALGLLVQFQSLGGNMGVIERQPLASGGTRLVWRMLHHNPVLRRHITENVMALAVQFLRLASGQVVTPQQIYLQHAPPEGRQRQEMDSFVQAPVHYNQGQNVIEISASVLALPVSPYDNQLRDTLAEQARQQLLRIQAQQDELGIIRHQIELAISDSLPRRQQVADRLGISQRTLDRRLAAAGLSWQQLLDTTRAQQARALLHNSDLKIAEISERLGFSDTRSFQRRFKQWTGLTPSAFRQQH